jgi:hypothetical protein
MKRWMLGFSIAVVAACAAAPVSAQEKASTADHGSVGALIGYGFKDGVGVGLGLRGGYTLPMNLYLGGTFVYHLGKSIGGATINVFYLGVEGGYDIAAGPVVIRPFLGLGPAFAHASIPSISIGGVSAGGSETSTKFGFWPGAEVLYPIQNFFIGADLRVLIVSDFTAFSMFATGGLQF